MRNQFRAILSMSALLVLCSQVSAVTVHTWRDSSGVTHFSDEPSPQGQASSTLEFEGLNKAITAEEDDFYSIANQWKRMKAERDAASHPATVARADSDGFRVITAVRCVSTSTYLRQ